MYNTLQNLPTEPTSSHSQQSTFSSTSSSNLKLFDTNFTRGSPSASYSAINFEPRLPVLVVDDDPLTRTLMKRILTRLGCQVSCAENGEVALEMILGQRIRIGGTPSSDVSGNSGPILEQVQETPLYEESKYAVVFLDNQMPVMSGLTVAAKLRQLERTDFIVGVTGNALLSDQEEYLEAGADRVLTKPVLERSLRDVLVQADEKRKSRQAEHDAPSSSPP
jgi:CheY-like chemotaxis protein